MKLIRSEREPFTLKDFEKGLMLAGYITPMTSSEFQEQNKLEEYEALLPSEKSSTYFKRTVLAAEIVHQLYKEPTLGRVKFQKLIYLCEHLVDMNLQERYSKFAAGPFDNKFMHSIDKEFKKQKWFNVEKISENNIIRYRYTPLENATNYKKYYIRYFGHTNKEIQSLINLFRKEKTDFTEIVATIFACLLEMHSSQIEMSIKSLLNLFYNWSDKKKRFSEIQVLNSLEWMKTNEIVPFKLKF